ncbi:MAG: putative colanic acid biosynthesis UDP-glucose lipid carrier transferase [Parvicella sp.]|jgi:putative colanic acid biosynthesis UDP-glucose lipid carrier transferase
MPSHRYSNYFPILFLIADLFCLNLGIIISNINRFGSPFYTNENYLVLQLILNAAWLIIFFATNLQEIKRENRLIDHLNKVLTALVINLSIVFALWFIAKPFYYSRQHLFISYLVFTFLLIFWRSIWHYFIRYYRTKGYNLRNVVIVGYGETATDLERFFRFNPAVGYKFLGYFDNNPDEARGRFLGRVLDLQNYVKEHAVDVIFCCLPRLYDDEVKRLIDFAENNLIKVKIVSQFSKLGNKSLSIQRYGDIPIINVGAIPLDNRSNQVIKRFFDIIFSSLVLIFIFSWLIPIIGLFIKLESNGPIFFKQSRNGRENHPFLCWKFRTMVINNESDSKQATKYDPRITRIGAILRKTSIDELPQFINVFIGDMSVVGPRPHPIKLNEQFQPKIDRFIQRHAVKPGITGLAQAKGFRGETSVFSDMSGRVRLDRFYVKNWSLVLDVKIIVLTMTSMMKGSENAY